MLYVLIAKTLMEHPNIMAPSKNNTIPPQIKYRKQVILMLGTVVVAFFVCLFPFRVFTLWILIAPNESVVNLGMEAYYNILYFCRIMIYINSAINPILYNIMSSKFRGGFLRLCGIRRLRSKYRNKGNRKPTFNTTSSTQNSSHQTSESFFSRYSSNKTTRTSSSTKDTRENTSTLDKDIAKVTNIEKTLRESYVRLSCNLKNGESYV
ncbi:Ethr [Trypoxylus dichotomus]